MDIDLLQQIKKEAELTDSDVVRIIEQSGSYVWFYINPLDGENVFPIIWNVTLTTTGKVKKGSLRHEQG
jgi:hypothetical protein